MKKTTRILGILLIAAMLLGALAMTASAAPATTTVDGATYYEIGSAEDLVWFANEVNENDQYKINGKLTANIDLSSVCSETLGSWKPISGYQGIFDGAGFEISGLYCTGQEMGGLFGRLYDANAVVKNVTVRGYVSGTRYVGGVVGYLYSTGAKVINCVNYATVSASNSSTSNDLYIGGVVGYFSGGEGSVMENCINYGDITAIPTVSGADVNIGGITGQSVEGSVIRNCANYGDVSDGDTTSVGWVNAGGIVGFTRGNVINCYNEGDLHQYGVKDSQKLGGIAGSAYDSAKIENCFNNGSISSDANANLGAVTGELFGTINNTYWNTEKTSLNASPYLGSASVVNNTSGLSAEELATGAVAYKMGDDWGQKIGTDPTPVLGGLKVYRNVEPTSTCSNPVYYYANSEDTNINHDTTLGAESFTDGICNNCGYVCTHPSATFTYSNVTNSSHDATYNCCNKLLSGEAHSFGTTDTCPCGETADASLTAVSTVTYYATLEDAIAAARSATDSTVTLLDNCSPEVGYWFTISDGKFTLDLNGKQITVVNSAYSAIVVESGNITLTDSAGGGGSNGGALVRGGGTLRVEGGTYGGKVSTTNGNLIVVGGSFAVVSLDYDANPGTLTLMGGKIATLQVRAQSGGKKMADVIVRDYYLADENGVLIDPNDAQLSDTYFYYLENVTVQRGADLSANAVVTVDNAIYNGSSQTPVVTVTVMGTELMMGVDFYFTYPEGYDITNAGTTELTIKAIGTYYTGETTATYTIERATLTEDSFTFDTLDFTYNFDPHSVSVSLPTGLDAQYVTVGYMKDGSPISGAPEDAGEYQVVVSVVGSPNHYDALFTYEMTIAPAPVEVEIAEVGAEFFYNGYSHEPQVIVTMNGGLPFIPTDFGGTVAYENNYDVGTAIVTVGGNYTGSCTFVIQKGNPTITATTPIDKVMPGYSITLTGVTDAFDNSFFPTEFSILPGEGYTFDGMTVTINDGVVYGSTIVVNIASTETRSYNSAVGTLALTVGVPVADTSELNNKITGLENTLKELEEKYGADVSALDQAIEDLKAQVGALDENGYATDAELAAAKAELSGAISDLAEDIAALANVYATIDALNAAKQALQDAIDTNTGNIAALTAELTAKYNELIALIGQLPDGVESMREYVDSTLTAAQTALQAAIDKVAADLATAQKDLQDAIDTNTGNIAALTAELTAKYNELIALIGQLPDGVESMREYVDSINETLTEADKTLQAAIEQVAADLATAQQALQNAIDANTGNIAALTTELTAKYNELIALIGQLPDGVESMREYVDSINETLTEADKTLQAAIDQVQANLEKAQKELQDAIDANETDIEAKVVALSEAIEAAKAAAAAGDAALRSELAAAQASLNASISAIAGDLAAAKESLANAIASGDAALADKIAALSNALDNVSAAYKAADRSLKSSLTTMIQEAEATLQSAIDKVAADLAAAQQALNEAIASGDKALDDKIAALNTALEAAIAASSAADEALSSEMKQAVAALEKAVAQVQKNLDEAKAELVAKDDAMQAELEKLNTFVIVVCVIAGTALCGCGVLVYFVFFGKRKLI